MKLGERLRATRQQKNLTIDDIAGLSGLSKPYISQVETGTARVPPENLVGWAKALGVDPQEFAKKLLSYYDPHTYKALFPKNG